MDSRMVRRSHKLCFTLLMTFLLGVSHVACKEDEKVEGTEANDVARMKLRSFWRIYGEATQLRAAGKFRQAVERYHEALQYNPSHEDSLYYLAGCLAELGDYAEAAQLYERLVTHNPASHRGHFQLGVSLATPLPGVPLDFSRARRAFVRNLEINQEESGPFLRLGDLALYEGRVQEAQKYFDTAAGFQSPEGMFRAGFVRYIQKEYATASGFFRKVLALNAHERQISGRGVQSEGDIQALRTRLTPLERAGIEALVYLYWTSRHLGGYSNEVPRESQLTRPQPHEVPFAFLPLPPENTERVTRVLPHIRSIRDFWSRDWKTSSEDAWAKIPDADLDGDGLPDPIEVCNSPALIRIRWKNGQPTTIKVNSRPIVDIDVLDFDGDGKPDLMALLWKAGLRLYRNTGSHVFEDVTAGSGLPPIESESFAATSLDYDHDGRPDILLAPYPPYVEVLSRLAHPDPEPSMYSMRLFRNTGNGRFIEVRGLAGLSEVHGVMRAVASDYDRDGYPDLFLACGGLDNYRLEPSVVLHNERGKAFSVAAYLPSFENPVRALGAEVLDFDGDGRPDIYLRTVDGLRLFRNVR